MRAVELSIAPRLRDIGDFTVNRVLPHAKRRAVGPFVFFDEMGPVAMAPGQGMDVRPHPHIGLATLTYLFEGAILHRDSLGTEQPIRPGDVNWMVAGRGIVHSERTGAAERAAGQRLHGLQTWVALPREEEERDPGFVHVPAGDLPEIAREGWRARVVAGRAFGETSPVPVLSETLYLDFELAPGAAVTPPAAAAERAIYPIGEGFSLDGAPVAPGTLLVLREGAEPVLSSAPGGRAVMVGGARLDAPRTIWWNFVSSRPERIERAKADWKAGAFVAVPGDDEFIPLPE